MVNRVGVIGGGIGGLAVTLGLRRAGFDAVVFERAPSFAEVGAGVGLWSNATRALEVLGAVDWLRDVACPVYVAAVSTWRGRTLASTDISDLVSTPGSACHVVHRADLHAALLAPLAGQGVESNCECIGLRDEGDAVHVMFANGREERFDLVVGADGLHSVVRRSLWGATPLRYSGQTCYRGIAPYAASELHVLREIQGPGQRAAVCPLDPERVYWWAAFNSPAGSPAPDDALEQLRARYRDWPFGVPDALAATDPTAILKNDLHDRRPLRSWSRGRVTLLGDAAHPTTPNLGQGACMALEDAVVLSRCLAEERVPEQALRRYEHERIRRTSAIVRQSWSFGRLATWSSAPAVWLRERMLASMPSSFLRRQIRRNIGYDVGLLLDVGDSAP